MRSFRCLLACLLVACGGGSPPPAAAPSASHATPPPAEHAHGDHVQHRFDDAQRWAKVFDDPARDEWQKPDQVVSALAVAPDALIADIGAGTGYFAVRLARAAPQGKVYGVDIEPSMVQYMGERAKKEGLANLVPVLATPDDPRLPEAVDLVLVVDTYHHIGDRTAYFQRLAASLRPGAHLAIVDFTHDAPMGPPVEHRIPPDQVTSELAAAGYHLIEHHDFLPNQYFLVYGR